MSFLAWLNRTSPWRRLQSILRQVAVPRGALTRQIGSFSLVLLVLVPFVVSWVQPLLVPACGVVVVLLAVLAAWWHWTGFSQGQSWVVGWVPLALYWSATYVLWLFLENPFFRLLTLLLLAVISWWYLREWHHGRVSLFHGERGAGVTPAIVLGFMTTFCLGVAAESFLVFLDTPFSLLLIFAWVPMVIAFICAVAAHGWSARLVATSSLTAAAVLFQVFLLVTWWPASFYVAGFTLAATWLTLVFLFQQEAQGFINRRTLARELAVVAVALLVVFLGTRWR